MGGGFACKLGASEPELPGCIGEDDLLSLRDFVSIALKSYTGQQQSQITSLPVEEGRLHSTEQSERYTNS